MPSNNAHNMQVERYTTPAGIDYVSANCTCGKVGTGWSTNPADAHHIDALPRADMTDTEILDVNDGGHHAWASGLYR